MRRMMIHPALRVVFVSIVLAISSRRGGQKSAPVESAFPPELYHGSLRFRDAPKCSPKRLHLAQAGDVNGRDVVDMTLSFSLDFAQCGGLHPTVYYGRGIQPEGSITDSQPVQFNYTSKVTGPYRSDWIYHVTLPKLKAGQYRYWYKVLVADQAWWWWHSRLGESRAFTFLTPPIRSIPTPTVLALVGDLGQTLNSTRTMDHIRQAMYTKNPVTQLLIAGDMSYADSDPTRWESWFDLMEPVLRSLPLHVAAGNHEIECDNVTSDIFVPYEHWFRNPNRIAPAEMLPVPEDYRKTLWHESCSTPSDFQGHYNYGNAFYAYEHGLAKIVVLSSYSDATVYSVQYTWLEKELQRVDRHRTPWLLVAFHSPLYTTFLGHIDETEARKMKEAMEPLFVQYGVNLVVSGHDHAYMRTKPMFQGHVDPTGRAPIYLTLGAGGNREHHSAGYRNATPESWVAKRALDDYGYGLLSLENDTHAHFHWMRDFTTHFGIHDDVWISNPHVSMSSTDRS